MKKMSFIMVVVFLMISASLAAAGTLDEVKKRGQLVCGVSTGLPGFSATDEKGNWKGLDVEGCRAIAAAVLGDAKSFLQSGGAVGLQKRQ